MTTDNTLSVVLRDEIHKLLAPLIAAVRQPEGVQFLLQSVGRADGLASSPEIRTEIERLAALATELAGLNGDSLDSWSGLENVLDLSGDLLTALRGVEGLVSDPSLGEQALDLGRDLAQELLALYLRARHPVAFRAASLLTLITPAESTPPDPLVISGTEIVRLPRQIDQFHPARIQDLINQPLQTLGSHYFPNGLATAADAHEAGRRLFPILTVLAQALGLPSFSDDIRAIPLPDTPPSPQNEDNNHFTEDEPGEVEALPPPEPVDLTEYYETFLPRFVFVLPGEVTDGSVAPARFALSAVLSSAAHPGGVNGLIITPLGQLNWSEERGEWRLSMESSGQVPAFVLGPEGVSLGSTNSPLTAANARFSIERVAAGGGPAFILGAEDGTRLEIGALRFTTDAQMAPGGSAVSVAAHAQSGAFVLAPGDGDSFLRAVLPEDGLRCEFDLGVELSSEKGLTFKGAAGLEATLPVGLSVHGVTIPTVHLNLHADGSGLTGEASATVDVAIGPFQAAIDRVGIAASLAFPEEGGNLGGADLDFRFKPPSGVGISIDADVVVGGGYLSFDPQKQEYSGVLQLQIADKISVKAIGLLTTRMPDGRSGFSLVALIFAEGFAPIQLGFGFSLTGIGGLLAINRTFDENVLRSGIKNHTLDSLMFPRDPVRNAPQIISNLNKVFPVSRGNHLFGPMLQISWGTPPLITANLALVLEFGARLRLLMLAQIAAILPKRENDLIRLQMDAVGIIDFDQGTASLDASLHDSRLLKKFVLTGDMAMRLKWKGSPNFALSVGGLHPAFNPPPAFPKLDRIAINLSSGDNPRFRCESYFAITSNTVQFGARAELFASAAGFSIHGDIGYDVLIQFDPFFFLADFHAQLQLKRGSSNLFKVRLEGSLAGPRPLHIKAKATFEILWWDVSIRIDKTLVAGVKPPPPEPIDVMPRLKEALRSPGNWVSLLPGSQRNLVTLRTLTPGPNDVFLHPLGSLSVKQNVVPLNLDISRFGQASPAGDRRFSISSVSIGGLSQDTHPVNDFFAPAQFFDLSDDQKLSRPSFESMTAGVAFTSNDVTFTSDSSDWLEVQAIQFETFFVGNLDNLPTQGEPHDPKNPYTLTPALLDKQALFGAAAISDIRRSGSAKFRTTSVAKHKIAKEGWSIVSTDDLTVRSVPGLPGDTPTNYSRAAEALRKFRLENPAQAAGLKILRLSEVSQN